MTDGNGFSVVAISLQHDADRSRDLAELLLAAFCFAQRAFCAFEIAARAAADIVRFFSDQIPSDALVRA